MKLLYSDPETGMSTILIRMAPGSEVPLHEHTELEQTYMLEERLVDDESECGLGDFVWRPGGNRHIARLKALCSSRSS
jgi:anti-sigma factor ChrR (cupin superfamily)